MGLSVNSELLMMCCAITRDTLPWRGAPVLLMQAGNPKGNGCVCTGQQIPTPEECQATFDSIGEDNLTATLTPCALGASDTCCDAVSETVNIASAAPLSGCELLFSG